MKRPKNLLLLTATLLFAAISFAQTKRALLIGIGTYADPRWKNLSSAADIKYLKDALILQGFSESNMVMLTDEQATHQGMVKAFSEFSKQVKPGDVVYVHFSGHGQQIMDDNGDEADGYDEALVPYDARGKYDPVQYQGENHFRDDELGKWLDMMRNSIGAKGSLLVVIDACHSGTATRSAQFAVVRGDPTPFASPEYHPTLKTNLSAAVSDGFLSAAEDKAANMVVFSASSPNQVNYETHDAQNNGVGSLSYGVARALQRMGKDVPYADLFAQVKAFIQADHPEQIPLMEGDGRQEVFAGEYLPQNNVLRIDRWVSDSSFTFGQGQLSGIYPGTIVKIIDAASHNTLGNATVSESSPVSSLAVVKKTLDKSTPYLVEIVSYGAPAFTTNVKLVTKGQVNAKQLDDLKQWLSTQPFVQLSESGDFMLQLTGDKNGTNMELVESGDALRWNTKIAANALLSDDDKKQLQAQLQAGARSKLLRNMPDGGPLSDKVRIDLEYQGVVAKATEETKLPRGAYYKLTIYNNSTEVLYYNLINILSTNETAVLLPPPGPDSHAQDFSIRPGLSVPIDSIQVDMDAKPGKEFMRVVLSPRVIDLRPVFEPPAPGDKKRGGTGPFEQWLGSVLDSNGKKPTTRSLGSDEVTVTSNSFMVIAKE